MPNQDLCFIYVDLVLSQNMFVFLLAGKEFSQTLENGGSQNLNPFRHNVVKWLRVANLNVID